MYDGGVRRRSDSTRVPAAGNLLSIGLDWRLNDLDNSEVGF